MTALFRQLLGEALDRTPAPVRALHDHPLPQRFEGEADMRAARNPLAKLAAFVAGFPQYEGRAAIAISIERDGDGQRWTRHFPRAPFVSRLQACNGWLCERLGPVEIRFRLHADAQGIVWEPVAWRTFGVVPMPAFLLRGTKARASVDADGRYRFEVEAAFPVLGFMGSYEGFLRVD